MINTYGGVLMDAMHRVLVRKPRGDRYGWTFAQGPARAGEAPVAAALRVVAETTGYRSDVVEALDEAFRGDETEARYWILQPRGHDRFRYEDTEAVTWVSPGEARRLLAQTRSPGDRARDLAVLEAVVETWSRKRGRG